MGVCSLPADTRRRDRHVTPPTPEQQDQALAALTGTITETKPGTDLERNLLRLRLIGEAKTRGVSWTVIGAALGVSGKEAKRTVKHLAAQTQRDLLVSRNPGLAATVERETGIGARIQSRATAREGAHLVPPKPVAPATRKRQHHIRRRGR